MNKNYIVNPVKATCMKFKNTNSIQGMNDTCFGICAAYSGTFDTYSMDPKCSQACADLIEQKKKQIFGVGSCDHQVPYRPVFWNQVPRYVPMLLKKGMSVEFARKQCKTLCQSSSLAAECIEKCDIDANAIEEYKEKPKIPPKLSEDNIIKKEEKNHPILFWTLISTISLAFVFILVRLLKR
jgi:hypothetical protein